MMIRMALRDAPGVDSERRWSGSSPARKISAKRKRDEGQTPMHIAQAAVHARRLSSASSSWESAAVVDGGISER